MESQSVLPSVKYECSKSACFAEEFYWFGLFFFFPEGWILAGGFGEKDERMKCVCG